MRPDKRRFIIRVQGEDMQSIVRQVNAALTQIEERLAGADAIGQRPDMKGQSIHNLGNLKQVADLESTATLPDVIDKINEILGAF